MYIIAKGQKIHSKQRKVSLELRKQVCPKMLFFWKLILKSCSRALTLRKQLIYKCEEAQKPYWKKIEHKSKNSEQKHHWIIDIVHFHTHTNPYQEMLFILNHTINGQVGVNSKPCFETLTLVSGHLIFKVFLKMPELKQLAAKMIIVTRVQLKI